MRNGDWRWNLAALLTAQTLMMAAFSFVFPFLPLYVQELGVKGRDEVAQWAGMIVASTSFTLAFAQPIWGSLADRFGRKPMVIRSMFSAAVIVTLMGLVSSPMELLVLRLVQGAFSGTVSASSALIATSTPKHRLAFALGLMQVSMFVGSSVGPIVGGVIADTVGFRVSFFAAGALMAVGTLIVVTMVREEFTPSASTESRGGMLRENWALLTMSMFPMVLAVNFLIHLGPVIVGPFLPLFIAELEPGENVATMAGIVLAGSGVTSALAAIALGRFGDRLDHGKILLICTLGMAVIYVPQALVQDVWQLFGLRLVMGIISGGLLPVAAAIVADVVPPERRGVAFGLISSGNAVGNVLGPLSGAAITTQLGIRSIFLVTGVLFAATYAWMIVEFRKRPLPETQADAGSALRESHS